MWPGPHRSSPHTAHCCVARAPLLIAPHCPLLCGQGPTAHRPILPTAVWPGPHCSLPHNKAPATGLTSPCTRHGHDLHGGQVCCTPSGPSACCALPVSPPPPGFPGNLSPLPRPGSRPTFLDTPLWTELCLPACATREAQSADPLHLPPPPPNWIWSPCSQGAQRPLHHEQVSKRVRLRLSLGRLHRQWQEDKTQMCTQPAAGALHAAPILAVQLHTQNLTL